LISDASIKDGVPPPKNMDGTLALSPTCSLANSISLINKSIYELDI
jgi:hypothetical protein